MKKIIIAAVSATAVAAVVVAHRKGWLPAAVSTKFTAASNATKDFFAKKQTVETPPAGDTTHASAPAAEEVVPAEAPKAEAPAATPAPEAANADSAAAAPGAQAA